VIIWASVKFVACMFIIMCVIVLTYVLDFSCTDIGISKVIKCRRTMNKQQNN